MKKKLAIFCSCAILFPVSERNTKMNNEIREIHDAIAAKLRSQGFSVAVDAVCCGCGQEVELEQEEADQWLELENFMCRECM